MGLMDSIFGIKSEKAKSKIVLAARRIEGKMHLFEISRDRAGQGNAVIKHRIKRTGEQYYKEISSKKINSKN